MKGKNAVFIMLLLCAACARPGKNTLYQTTKTKAQNYLAKNLSTASRYEPVSFRGLDSIVQSHLNDVIYLQYDDSITAVEAMRFREMGENFKLFKQREAAGFYDKRLNHFKHKRDSVAGVIEPDFVGYKLVHYFKTADTTGVKILKKYVFIFDKEGNLLNVIK